MPSKVWERTKVVFAPTEPYPFSRRIAPWPCLWLGCWTAKIAVTLDTLLVYHSMVKCGQKSFDVDRRDSHHWNRKNGANRARTSASSRNFSIAVRRFECRMRGRGLVVQACNLLH